MQPKVTDVERLKKQVRKLAAGQVLSGDSGEVYLEMGKMRGCRAVIAAGYGPFSKTPQPIPRDRLIWILDGFAEIQDSTGQMANISQGECTVLIGGKTYHLTFPKLTIYLSVESEEMD